MPNIEPRGNTWYATLHVPKDVREKLGRSKFFETLKTTDKRVAEARARVVVAGWKAQIQQARGNDDPFIAKAMEWQRAIAQQASEEAAEAVESLLLEHAENTIEPNQGTAKAQAFVAIATGQHKALSLIVPEWKAHLRLEQKSIDQMEKDVGRMIAKFPTIAGMTRRAVLEWLKGLATDGPGKQSPSSIRRIVWSCRNFWGYLQEHEEAPKDGECPIVVPSFAKASKRKGTAANSWIPFAPADVVALHREAVKKDDQQLADLIVLGAFTGARIEELCSIKVIDVQGTSSFNITDAKTKAGVREVPIHSKLAETVQRLKDASTDGYLLSGLTFNKYADRSNAVGKRFGRLRTATGHGSQYVFHSIRKTVVTLLENAGISENLAADIVGHDKPRITYGLYSDGATLALKREALERVAYPDWL